MKTYSAEWWTCTLIGIGFIVAAVLGWEVIKLAIWGLYIITR